MARREFPDAPIVGIGAVVLEDNRVLLVRRGKAPLKGEWSLPGGALELGETLEAGVRREVAEETGFEVEVLAVVDVLDSMVWEEEPPKSLLRPSPSGNPARPKTDCLRVRYHYVLIDFLCVPTGGCLGCGSDAEDARWASCSDLGPDGPWKLLPVTVAVIQKAVQQKEARQRAIATAD